MKNAKIQEMYTNWETLKGTTKDYYDPLLKRFATVPLVDTSNVKLYTKQLFDIEYLLDYIDKLESKEVQL